MQTTHRVQTVQAVQSVLSRRWIMKLHSMMLVVMLIALLGACAPVQPAPSAESASGGQVVEDHSNHEQMGDPSAQLGEVDFSVSCTPEAQAAFSHGMALLHSFEYETAIQAFNSAAELDASCAMAHWGVAMSLVEPLWGDRCLLSR
jgi:hypothetical protein